MRHVHELYGTAPSPTVIGPRDGTATICWTPGTALRAAGPVGTSGSPFPEPPGASGSTGPLPFVEPAKPCRASAHASIVATSAKTRALCCCLLNNVMSPLLL